MRRRKNAPISKRDKAALRRILKDHKGRRNNPRGAGRYDVLARTGTRWYVCARSLSLTEARKEMQYQQKAELNERPVLEAKLRPAKGPKRRYNPKRVTWSNIAPKIDRHLINELRWMATWNRAFKRAVSPILAQIQAGKPNVVAAERAINKAYEAPESEHDEPDELPLSVEMWFRGSAGMRRNPDAWTKFRRAGKHQWKYSGGWAHKMNRRKLSKWGKARARAGRRLSREDLGPRPPLRSPSWPTNWQKRNPYRADLVPKSKAGREAYKRRLKHMSPAARKALILALANPKRGKKSRRWRTGHTAGMKKSARAQKSWINKHRVRRNCGR